jgi:hypothetical protein
MLKVESIVGGETRSNRGDQFPCRGASETILRKQSLLLPLDLLIPSSAGVWRELSESEVRNHRGLHEGQNERAERQKFMTEHIFFT